MTVSTLRRLNEIITSAIDDIDAHLSESSLAYPSLDKPYDPTNPVETLLLDPELLRVASLITAAASQMIACVRHPAQTLIDEVFSVHVTSCIRTVIEADIVEIVRDAGPAGIHCADIAKANGADPAKTGRILRLLSNRHIFKEVAPDVFALNRISSMMDTGKSITVLREKPEEKHVGTSGLAAYLCHGGDEIMRGSAFIPEAYSNPNTAHSVSPRETPCNLGFNTSDQFFDWLEKPENDGRRTRFGIAMAGTSKMGPKDSILAGFDWRSLREGGVVVDVAGGIGASSMTIVNHAPHLNIIVQDREEVVEQGHRYWKKNSPKILSSGRVKLEVRDLFAVQPVKNAAAFLLRFIIHDWADPFAKVILNRLREAAAPDTKLVVIDVLVPYTCRSAVSEDIPGSAQLEEMVPEPLLPSLGPVSDMKFFLDMGMYVIFNSQERTVAHFSSLVAECGWKVVQVYHIPGSVTGQYVAVPI